METKCKFLNLGYLQKLSNYIQAYNLFTIPWNMYMEFKLQVFQPLFDPRDENKNSKTLLSTRYTQSYVLVSFLYYFNYYLKCRWSLSDKP